MNLPASIYLHISLSSCINMCLYLLLSSILCFLSKLHNSGDEETIPSFL